MGKFDSFFSSQKLFTVSFIAAMALLAFRLVCETVPGIFDFSNAESKAIIIIFIVLTVILFVSFRKHSDRTMTSVMGAIFMVLMLSTMLIFINGFNNGMMQNTVSGDFDGVNTAVEESLADSYGEMTGFEGGEMPGITDGEISGPEGGGMPSMNGENPEMPGGSGIEELGHNIIDGTKFVYSIATVFMFVLYCLMFASHLMIHAGKKYVRKQVRFNQIVTIILFAATIAYFIIILCTAPDFWGVLSGIIIDLACLFILAMLVCVESKLGVYKLRRAELTEEGTWTEEEKEATKKQLFGD